jgi:hypothetical protein
MQPALGPATRLVGLYGRSLATTLRRPDSETTPAGVLEKLVETRSLLQVLPASPIRISTGLHFPDF